MPKYYCNYCDIYLTHDAIRVRRDHNSGWKHCSNVKTYFMEQANKLQMQLDAIYKAYIDAGEIPPPPPTALLSGQTTWGAGLVTSSSLRPAIALGNPDDLGGMVPIVPAGAPVQLPQVSQLPLLPQLPPAPVFHPGLMMAGLPVPPPPPPPFLPNLPSNVSIPPPPPPPFLPNYPPFSHANQYQN